MIQSVGIVGANGNFGMFVNKCLREYAKGIEIRLWDTEGFNQRNNKDYVLAADVVIFAVPPKAYESVLAVCVPQTRMDTILVDVCTVKVHTVKLLRRLAQGRRFIATHPMFGPQSYRENSDSLRGLQITICESTLPPKIETELRALLKRLQLDVIDMTPEEHDRNAAEEQLLTQYIGRIVAHAGFARSESGAHTVSSRHFYTAMDIVSKDKKLFEDASDLNPFWAEIEARFEVAAAQLRLDMVTRRNGRH